jgi:succinate dehydrogenase / fumarate reductase membrane anchor subunit
MARSLKTPLGRVRGLGSAKAGTEHFAMQRLTAVSNLVVVTGAIVVVLLAAFQPYGRALAVVGHPVAQIVLIGFVLSVTMHMRIGMQVIIEDYVHAELPKIALLVANTLLAAGVALAGVYAVLKIGFGG